MNKKILRFVPFAVLFAGFPAWIIWWLESPHLLAYAYATLSYVVVMFAVGIWAIIKALA